MSETMARCGGRLQKSAVLMPDSVVPVLWLVLGLWGWHWLGPMWVAAMRPTPDRINDFYQDWASARTHLVGLPVYTHHATSIPQHLGLPCNPVPSIEYNAHPPTSVLVALPLARLDYPNAVLVWNMISLAALIVSLTIVASELALPWRTLPPTLALLAFCHPVYGNFYQGQLTLILLLLVTTIWALERSGWPSTAGLLLGTAAAIKLFPAYLAVYYMARGRRQLLLTATVSFLALTLATALVLGLDAYHDYVWVVLPGQAKFRSFSYNLSIAGFWYKLFNPVAETGPVEPLWLSPTLARWGTVLMDLAITMIVATIAYRARSLVQRDLAFASTVTAMLMVSPVTWDFSLPLLLVPIAVIARGTVKSQLRWMPATLVLILAIGWIPQNMLTELAQAGRSFSVFSWTFMLGAPSLKFYALLGTFVLGLTAFRAEKKEEKGPGSNSAFFG
jgi:alpha-1,2-mannosyltransferase